MMSSDHLARLNAELQPFLHLPCVGGKQYLGSMFFLDFGGRFNATARGGRPIEIGVMTLSIRNVAWWIHQKSGVDLSAEQASPEQFDSVARSLEGTTIAGLTISAERRLRIEFRNAWLLAVDLSNQWSTDTDILEIAAPDGRLIAIRSNGDVLFDAGFDAERSSNWKRSRLRH
jgi:hypothetical protein